MGLDSKKDVHLDGSTRGSVGRLEVLEGPSGRRVRSEAERARIVAESLLPGAQVSEVARKHGATRWQIYDWRRRFRQRGMLPGRGIAADIRAAGRGRCVGGASDSGDQA
ncbi:transposase-like protein [Bradyrhizobium sp. LM2.7]